MNETPKVKPDEPVRIVPEKPPNDENEAGCYYYDDAHGYETFEPEADLDDEED